MRQGATLERTVDFAPGKVRLSLAGGEGQVELLDPSGRTAGYGPAGAWIEVAAESVHDDGDAGEDLAQKAHAVGEFVLKSGATVERRANPALGILKWALKRAAR